MNYILLPNSELKVSTICLGTMTFGNQNTEAEAHAQLDYAIEKGINFIDTAEMYPIGGNAQIVGSTEKHIGSWLHKIGSSEREKLVIATKIAGPNRGLEYIRQPLDFSKKKHPWCGKLEFEKFTNWHYWFVSNALARAHYEYVWPTRVTQIDTNWKDNIFEVLTIFDGLIKEGKIRNIGVSNENPYGVMRFLQESEKHNLPRISTIQNPYSLLNRLYEVGLSEVCMRENVGLLAYSPLGFGSLSGKYLGEVKPEYRMTKFPQFTRYTSENCTKAIKLYKELAEANNLTIAQMAIAFVNQQNLVTSTIIGATSLEQLKENITAFEVVLAPEILMEINKIQELIPNPAP